MKKILFVATLIFFVLVSVNASVKMIAISSELESLTINCHTDYSIIIEFPKNIIIEKIVKEGVSTSQWSVDHDLNLLWAQPAKIDIADCVVIVQTDKYDHVKLRFRVEKDPKELTHTIVLKESVFRKKRKFLDVDKNETFVKQENVKIESENEQLRSKQKVSDVKDRSNVLLEESSGNVKKKVEEEKNYDVLEETNIKRSFDFDTFVSLSGGTQSFGDSSFMMEGEVIVAAKDERGFFFQGAGKTLINNMIKQYGFSFGVGFEPNQLGVFLFGDVISHKFGEEFNSTNHLQIRPSIRYRLSDKIHVAGFFALPIGSWQYTGVEVTGNSGFGYYNKSLSHAGLDLSAYLKKMFVDIRVLITEGSAFGIDLKAGYEIIRQIFVTVNYIYQTSGNYEYLDGISNTSRISVGVTFNMRNFEKRSKDRLIFRPDYPMIVVAEKELDESQKSPEIILEADPTSGYAPLNVSYKASPSGFDGNVAMIWYFNTTYSTPNDHTAPTFEYSNPGSYQAWVEGTDEKGQYAKSNVIIISVWDIDSTNIHTISSSVRSGEGSIDPLGDIVVGNEADQKFVISPAEGWFIKNVYCDGSSVGSVSEYEFIRVCNDHSIEVEFSETAPTTHTITVSVKNNQYGSISPGTTQVEHGSDISFVFTPEDNNKQVIRYWVNGQQFNEEDIAEYSFKNVTSDQTLEVEFDWIYYDVRVTLSFAGDSGASGHIDPGVGTFTQKAGTSATFNFIADNAYTIVTSIRVNGNNKAIADHFKFTALDRDYNLDVVMERPIYQLDVDVSGCAVDINCTTHAGSGPGTYNVRAGDDIRFTFTPLGTDYYFLGVQDDGSFSAGAMPSSYTFRNVTRPGNWAKVKCATTPEMPPF